MSEGGHKSKTEILPLVHNSVVQALSYRKVDQSILSGSGTNIFTTDLRKSQLFKKAKISNVVRHIHMHPQEANLSILEVRTVAPALIGTTQLLRPGRPFGFSDTTV